MTTQISKPYPHGPNRWRCRTRTPTGWRWCASADSPEEATRMAQKIEGPAQPSGEVRHQDPSQDPDPAPAVHVQQPAQVGAVKISGPYRHADGYRCRITSSSGRSWASTAATENQALRLAEKQAATSALQGNLSIADAIEAYVRSQQAADARPSTLEGTRRALTVYWSGMLDWPVGRITPRRAQEQYDALQVWVGPRGHTLAVATHRSYVQTARSWGRWVVAKGWMRGPSADKEEGGRPQEARQAAALLG